MSFTFKKALSLNKKILWSIIVLLVCVWTYFTYAAAWWSADLKIFTSGPTTGLNGEAFTYTVVIQNGWLDEAAWSTFVNTFPAWAKDIVATCTNTTNGASCPTSFGTSSTQVQGTIPTFPYNWSVEITISGRYSVTSNSSVSNIATVQVPSNMTEVDSSTNSSQTNTVITVRPADIQTTMTWFAWTGWEFGDTISYSVAYTNNWSGPADWAYIYDYLFFYYSTGYFYGNLTYSDLSITCTAYSGAVCPVLSSVANSGTMSLGNSIYPYSTYIPTFPSWWKVVLSVSIKPLSFTNNTTCGPNQWSRLDFRTYADAWVPSGITDPVYNQYVWRANYYGPYQPVPPCPEVDIKTTSTQSSWNWTMNNPMEYNITYTNKWPNDWSWAYIYDYVNLPYASWYVQGQLTYTGLTVTCTASWGASCPTNFSTPSSWWSLYVNNSLYFYSANVANSWPTSWTISFKINFTPTSFTNTTTCGPNYGSQIYFYNVVNGNPPSWYTDPNTSDNYTYNYSYWPYQQVDPCPVADLVVSGSVSSWNWNIWTPITYTYTFKNNGPNSVSWAYIWSYMNYNYYFTFKDRTVTCVASWDVVCPNFYNALSQWSSSNLYTYNGTQVANWGSWASMTITETFTPLEIEGNYCASNSTSLSVSPYRYLYANVPSGITDPVYNQSQYIYSNYNFSCVDLTISKVVDPSTVAPNSPMLFTLNVSNAALATANNSLLEDVLPAWFTYASGSCTANGGASCGSLDYNITSRLFSSVIPTLPNGWQLIYTLFGTSIGSSSIWSNIATITATWQVLERSSNTNTAQVNFSIIGTDPLIRKISLDKNVNPGGLIRYQITIINPNDWELIENSSVTDILPTWFTYDSDIAVTLGSGTTRISTSNPTSGSTTPAWGSFSMLPWGTLQITFNARVATNITCGVSWKISNTARYDYYAQISHTWSRVFNGEDVGNYTDDAWCTPALSMSKVVNKTVITGWDMLTWTINVYNTWALATTWLITINDYLNTSALSNISVTTSSGVSCNGTYNPLTCNIPAGLEAYTGVAQVFITANVHEYSYSSINNSASVIYNNNSVACNASWCNPYTNITPIRAKIAFTKNVDKQTITWQDTLTYTITLQNTGTVTNKWDIINQFYIPTSQYAVTAINTPIWVTCPSVADLSGQNYMTCTIASWSLTNLGDTVTYSYSVLTKSNLANNTWFDNGYNSIYSNLWWQATFVTSLGNGTRLEKPFARVSFVKNVDKQTITWQDTLIYTIILQNTGTIVNTNDIVNQFYIPTWQYTVSAISTSTGVVCPSVIDLSGQNYMTCTIASWALANPGDTITYSYSVLTKDNLPNNTWFDNSLNSIYSSPANDVQFTNTLGNWTRLEKPSARLKIFKKVDKTASLPGDDITYTVSVVNSGLIANEWTITVYDYPLSWYGPNQIVTDVQTQSWFNCPPLVDWTWNNTITCTIDPGVLQWWQTLTLTIKVHISDTARQNEWYGNYVQMNTSSSADLIDQNNMWAWGNIIIPSALMKLSKTVDKYVVNTGEELTYTIGIWNSGTLANSSPIRINEYILNSNMLDVVNVQTSNSDIICPSLVDWTWNNTITCTIWSWLLDANERVNLTITAKVKDTVGVNSTISNQVDIQPDSQDLDRYEDNWKNAQSYVGDGAVLIVKKVVDKYITPAWTVINYTTNIQNVGTRDSQWELNLQESININDSTNGLTEGLQLLSVDTPSWITCPTLNNWQAWSWSSYSQIYANCTILSWALAAWSTKNVTLSVLLPYSASTGNTIDGNVNVWFNQWAPWNVILKSWDSVRTFIGQETVVATATILTAPDFMTLAEWSGGEMDILSNDTINWLPITTWNSTISLTWTIPSWIQWNSTLNKLVISPLLVPGSHIVSYQVCTPDMQTCSIWTATIVVNPKSVWYAWWWGSTPIIPIKPTQPEKPTKPVDPIVVPWGVDEAIVFNDSIEDGKCYRRWTWETIDQGNEVSELFKTAHQMLYSYGLTKWQWTLDYGPQLQITREEAARFMTNFAKNVLCRKKTKTYDNQFSDINQADSTLTSYVKQSYEYEIFKWDPQGTFRPRSFISSDELTAVMVRLVTNKIQPELWSDWAAEYRKLLQWYTSTAFVSLHRSNIAEVLYDLYRNNDYDRTSIWYIIK